MSVLPLLPEDRSLLLFNHIFAADTRPVITAISGPRCCSADAFSAFEEAGLDNDPALARIGRRFRDTVLAREAAATRSTSSKTSAAENRVLTSCYATAVWLEPSQTAE